MTLCSLSYIVCYIQSVIVTVDISSSITLASVGVCLQLQHVCLFFILRCQLFYVIQSVGRFAP